MGDNIQTIFDNIDKCFDDIHDRLRNHELGGVSVCLENMEENLDSLQGEIDRELKLSQIERELYTSPKSLDETLDHIANIIKKEFEFSRFDIVLVDQELKRVMRRYAKGGFGEADFEKLKAHGALGVTRDYCLTHQEPWIVNDIKGQDPRWKLALELDVWVHGTFPLYLTKKSGKDELVGFLHGARTKRDFLAGKIYSEADVAEIKRLGRAITNAIKEAKLAYFEHSIMRIQDVIGSTKIEMVVEMPQDLDEEKTKNQMDIVLDTIIDALGASYGGILVQEKNQVISFCFRDDKNQNITHDRIGFSPRPLTGLVGRALFEGFPVIENEVIKNKDRMDLEIKSLSDPIHTLVAIPLIESYSEEGVVRKNVIGVIILLNKKDEKKRIIKTDHEGNEGGFFTLDRQVLESISPHIETIISNTRRHRELQIISITNGLTELANHTHFMNNLLTLEFKRSQRYGTPLSVLLMDIDHFKVFNDIFGHQVGDLVLKEVGKILKNNTREVDHIARYGGEEFAVILHNTPLEDAIKYANKIRIKISEGDYIKKIEEHQLFDVVEAAKRFRAIYDMDDTRIKDAKMSVINRHFKLDIKEVLDLLDEEKIPLAVETIMKSFRVTISVGLAFYPNPRITSKKDLITMADMLLLKAKEQGRNRVEAVEIK